MTQAASPQGSTAQTPLPYGPPIGLEAAKKAMAAAEAEARRNNWSVVICILDSGGHVVMMQRLDNTQYGSIQVAQGKAHTALDFRRPSKAFQDTIARGGETMGYLTFANITAVQGGVLIVAQNQIIGAIGVSGVTSAQDEQIALAGVSAITG